MSETPQHMLVVSKCLKKQTKSVKKLFHNTLENLKKSLEHSRYDECDAQILKTDYCDQNRSLDVTLRFLSPEDITEIQQLCLDFFPIEYPFSWYEFVLK